MLRTIIKKWYLIVPCRLVGLIFFSFSVLFSSSSNFPDYLAVVSDIWFQLSYQSIITTLYKHIEELSGLCHMWTSFDHIARVSNHTISLQGWSVVWNINQNIYWLKCMDVWIAKYATSASILGQHWANMDRFQAWPPILILWTKEWTQWSKSYAPWNYMIYGYLQCSFLDFWTHLMFCFICLFFLAIHNS